MSKVNFTFFLVDSPLNDDVGDDDERGDDTPHDGHHQQHPLDFVVEIFRTDVAVVVREVEQLKIFSSSQVEQTDDSNLQHDDDSVDDEKGDEEEAGLAVDSTVPKHRDDQAANTNSKTQIHQVAPASSLVEDAVVIQERILHDLYLENIFELLHVMTDLWLVADDEARHCDDEERCHGHHEGCQDIKTFNFHVLMIVVNCCWLNSCINDTDEVQGLDGSYNWTEGKSVIPSSNCFTISDHADYNSLIFQS